MRCDVCGRFAKIVDSYCDFGHAGDAEPPDDVLMCQKCVDKDIAECRKSNSMPVHWLRANYEEQLAKELGFIWYVEPGCAWGLWKRQEQSV